MENGRTTASLDPMSPNEAIRRLQDCFPFAGYLDRAITPSRNAFRTVANTALRYLRPGSKILDFGCGPCDKTALLQFLGYQSSGYDDLQDDWHQLPGNREKILAFARECGIDFKLASGGPLPFEKHSFDMITLFDVIEHLHNSPRDLLTTYLN